MAPGTQFQMYELTKQGNIFVGKRRERGVCTYRDTVWTGQTFSNTCSVEFNVELKSMTNERIEGRILYPEKGNTFNCKKCRFAKPLSEWTDFVWIPE